MRKVYKYKISLGENKLDLPRYAEILSVGIQEHQMYLWCLVDPEEARIYEKKIYVTGTGNSIPDRDFGLKFIGTIQEIDNGVIFQWHAFEDFN